MIINNKSNTKNFRDKNLLKSKLNTAQNETNRRIPISFSSLSQKPLSGFQSLSQKHVLKKKNFPPPSYEPSQLTRLRSKALVSLFHSLSFPPTKNSTRSLISGTHFSVPSSQFPQIIFYIHEFELNFVLKSVICLLLYW